MPTLSDYLVEQILKEDDNTIKNIVVAYVGRFQPMHKGHYQVYKHLTKEFGKDSVFVGTSDKVNPPRSPFNFKEKKEIMTRLYKIPSNKVVKVKNPYAPKEILSKFDPKDTAFVTVVGEKDKNRLSGKYFKPWDGNPTVGYDERGYVYTIPILGGGISGTESREGLSTGSDEDKKEFFKRRVFGKFDPKIYKMVTDKLKESRYSLTDYKSFLIERSITQPSGVDDGPVAYFPNLKVFNDVNIKRAAKIGYEVVGNKLSDELEKGTQYPEYPDGPVTAVSYFPAGKVGEKTANKQIEIFSDQAYEEWKKHVTRKMALAGYEVISSTEKGREEEEEADRTANTGKEVEQDFEKNLQEHYETIWNETIGKTINEIPMKTLKQVDKFADKQLSPVDIDLMGKHFFDRLKDPRNKKEITSGELVRFFKRLGRDKKKFLNFLDKYNQIVATDTKTNINIPFMKKANRVIAKTVMRKDGFKTSNVHMKFENKKDFDRLKYYEEYYKNLSPSGFNVQIEENKVKIEIPDNTTSLTEDVKLLPKTLNIPRNKMPQVQSKNMRDYVSYLKKNGVKVGSKLIPIKKLKLTQKDINTDKIKKLIGVEKSNLDKPVVTSNDNYILDGHHRTLALYNMDKDFKIKSIYVDLPIKKLLDITSKYPKVFFKGINESIEDDHGKDPYVVNLEDLTVSNTNFRTTKWTGSDLQMTLMSIQPSSDIGLEVHENGDQFLRIEQGSGLVKMGDSEDNLWFEEEVKDDFAIFIPKGYYHNVVNTGKEPLQLYAIYAPPEHPSGKVDTVKVDEMLREWSPFKLKKGFKFKANKSFKDIKKGYEYIIQNITGDIGNKVFTIIQKGTRKPIKVPARSMEDFYSKIMIGEVINEGNNISGLPSGNNSTRWTPPNQSRNLKIPQLSGYTQVDFPVADELDISKEKYNWEGGGKSKKYNNKVRAVRKTDGTLVFESFWIKEIKNKSIREFVKEQLDDRILLQCGGSYGHMDHPFDREIDLTFGDLKKIVKDALNGELDVAVEKLDGQALSISWRDDKGGLIAARNKSHLKNSGENAMDISDVSKKFQNRGALTDAYNFAMNDLSRAISSLSDKQRDKIFMNGRSFMNLEVIYPESANVIQYDKSFLVFHGTMEYNDDGVPVGENKQAARILAGMIRQVNKDVQDTYTIKGPPVLELPKNQELQDKKSKYLKMINRLQREFKLKDNDGVSEYHQAWWDEWIEKNKPSDIPDDVKEGLLKRWAFDDKSFRLNGKNIEDKDLLKWAKKVDKQSKAKIEKENIMKFEEIFLGVGAEVLQFTSSALAVNPDKSLRDLKKRLDSTIKDIRKSGDPKKLEKLELELRRLQNVGEDKIVPIEGIVFTGPKGNTLKLTGNYAALNQLLGIMYY